jgi:predicted amidophosphoribosyltransferase
MHRRAELMAEWKRAKAFGATPTCTRCGEPLPAAATDGTPARYCPACGDPHQRAS